MKVILNLFKTLRNVVEYKQRFEFIVANNIK